MKYLHTSILMLSTVLLAACGSSAKKSAFPESIEVGTRPESITKGFDGDYFVTVMGEQGPGNAHIARIRDGVVSVFSDGMDEPKGIAFDGSHLYATDQKRVWRVDSTGLKTQLAVESDFPVAISFLNDAAVSKDGRTLYVTDMGANDKMFGPDGFWPLDSEQAKSIPVIGRVFKISLPDGKVEIAVDADPLMPCPNGVGIGKDGQLLIGAFFRGNLIEVRDGRLQVVADGFRGADAVEQDTAGNYYVSSWNGAKVWKVDGKTKEVTILIEGLKSAADFYLDEENGRILLPDMTAGTVIRLDL